MVQLGGKVIITPWRQGCMAIRWPMGRGFGGQKMASPTTAPPMVFMLTSNARQALYPENTPTSYCTMAFWLQRLMFRWELQEDLISDPKAARALVGIYAIRKWCPPPASYPVAYLVNMDHARLWEHWVAVFLKVSQRSEYFASSGMAPLEPIY